MASVQVVVESHPWPNGDEKRTINYATPKDVEKLKAQIEELHRCLQRQNRPTPPSAPVVVPDREETLRMLRENMQEDLLKVLEPCYSSIAGWKTDLAELINQQAKEIKSLRAQVAELQKQRRK